MIKFAQHFLIMDKIINGLFSMRLMALLMFVFAFAIGLATFIEKEHGVEAAQLLIFRASWFEVVIFLLGINFIANMFKYKMFRKEKIAILTFHIAFVIIIIGAAITRYVSYEGVMIINEGETVDYIHTAEPYLTINVNSGDKAYTVSHKYLASELSNNSFEYNAEFPNTDPVKIEYVDFIPNAIEDVRPGKKNVLHLKVPAHYGGYPSEDPSQQGMRSIYLEDGDIIPLENVELAFNNPFAQNAIQITSSENGLMVSAPNPISRMSMVDRKFDTIPPNTKVPLEYRKLNTMLGNQFVLKSFHKNAEVYAYKGLNKDDKNLLKIKINHGKESRIVKVAGSKGFGAIPKQFAFKGVLCNISYGAKKLKVPFGVRLDDFRLENYPGSESPKSFESDVTVIDNGKEIKRNIFMNNVLDYGGYRFFQSSYNYSQPGGEADITQLSVNHDYWGTLITYIGYILLGLGAVFTLFMSKTRYTAIRKKIRELQKVREKAVATIILLLISFGGISQDQSYTPIDVDHANKFSEILVQSNGRIQPVNSLAKDVILKLYKKRSYNDLNYNQVFLGMMFHQEHWMEQKMIKVGSPILQDILKIEGKYASYNDFFRDTLVYKKIEEEIIKATNVHPKEQTKHHKETIKVNERFRIADQIYYGMYLKIYPIPNDPGDLWKSPFESLIESNTGQSKDNFHKAFGPYVMALTSRDYAEADKQIEIIKETQKSTANPEVLPSESEIKWEIFYNEAYLFFPLMLLYLMIGLIYLIICIVEIVAVTSLHRYVHYGFQFTLIAVFGLHAFNLGLRWYITGHAPWTNGFEALTYISFACGIAGISFARASRLTLAAASILAGMILGIAMGADYDPQLTNLQPVLQSVWLVIHVCIITSSYAFLGLAFILGLINMFLYLVKSRKNVTNIKHAEKELTYVSELTMTVGLFMAAIGTFLGGVWANESWGRYWGWDPKETWALVIVIIYAMILHFRFIPGLKSKFALNVASIWAYSTVIFTYFGVNYYLGIGLHSYAQGDQAVFPTYLWVIIGVLLALCTWAGIKEKNNRNLKPL